MAIEVIDFTPRFVKLDGDRLRVGFTNDSITLNIEGQIYCFRPLECCEILINATTKKVINRNDQFIFRRGFQIIKIAVSRLLTEPKVKECLRNHLRNVEDRIFSHMLSLEQDYELASLSQAMKENDNAEIIRSKKRLKEIHNELEDIAVYG